MNSKIEEKLKELEKLCDTYILNLNNLKEENKKLKKEITLLENKNKTLSINENPKNDRNKKIIGEKLLKLSEKIEKYINRGH